MITLTPPAGTTPHRITTHSGATYFLQKGNVIVSDEDDARDLESRGWQRDAASAKAVRYTDHLLRKAVEAQARHAFGGDAVSRRLEFGEVDAGRVGRVMVAHDQGSDEIIVHGVTAGLSDIDGDLRSAFRVASASYVDAAQDQAAQTDAKALIGVVTSAILDRHDWVGSKVREKKFAQRHRV